MRTDRLSQGAEIGLVEVWDYTVCTWGVTQAESALMQLESRSYDLAARAFALHLSGVCERSFGLIERSLPIQYRVVDLMVTRLNYVEFSDFHAGRNTGGHVEAGSA